MVDVVVFAIAIASAVSLLIISPHEAQRKALRALRAYGKTEASPTGGRGEDLARPDRHIGFGRIGSCSEPCFNNAEYCLRKM
jgi:hypothetical protein